MFVNLEDIMSKEDVNSILRSVDTHPKPDAFVCLVLFDFVCFVVVIVVIVFFKVSFSRWCVLIIYRTTRNLPAYD